MGLFRRSPRPDDHDTVSLSDANHAWWADRDELQKTFVPKKRTVPGTQAAGDTGRGRSTFGVDDAASASFFDRSPTDSLFRWATEPEPDDPTYGGSGLPLDPYRVLGLQPGAPLGDVIAAHRTLAKRFHPDQHIAAPAAEQQAAAEKMANVNAAYQEIRSRITSSQPRR